MRLRNFACACAVGANAVLGNACSTDTVTSARGANPASTAEPRAADAVVTRHGFVWSSERGLEVLPVPANATSMDVSAINNHGQVAGTVTLGASTENYRAFTWSPSGGYTALGSLVGPDGISTASSITDAGDVTGLSEGPSSDLIGGPMGIQLNDAFIWNATSGMKAIPLLPRSPEFKAIDAGGKLMLPTGTNCVDVVVRTNASGQAIGYAGTMEKRGCRGSTALLWNANGQFVVIGQCDTWATCHTSLAALNNRGEVVGSSDGVGFKWTAAKGMMRIPMANTHVSVVNDNGDAAGVVGTGASLTLFIWLASGEIKILRMPAGANYGFPVALNNQGVLAGSFG